MHACEQSAHALDTFLERPLKIPVGTPLVHPVHGPTILKDITTRTIGGVEEEYACLLYTSPSPRD